MPNYDFKCEDCNYKFSKRVSFEKKDEVHCPECESGNTKQIFTSVMIQGGTSSGAPGISGGKSACSTCGGGSCC